MDTTISVARRLKLVLAIASCLACSIGGQVNASESEPAPEPIFYKNHPETTKWISKMVSQHGFKKAELQSLFQEVERKDKILASIKRPAEKTMTWERYRGIFLKEDRIAGGQAFRETHKEILKKAEVEYGVPPEIITAILGVETLYGERMGTYRVIDALSTLGFDYPRRSKFFQKELTEFLILAREEGADPTALNGSYAGAMGFGQFMPSSYRAYAVDFDKDGQRDIWKNESDAIGSVANYFRRHKWKTGAPIVTKATVKGSAFKSKVNKKLRPYITIGELAKLGVTTDLKLPSTEKVTLMELEGANGLEYWVGLHNFYVITRYNHSRLYGMAVHDLSKAINNTL